jgi:hypothetical protein
VDLYIHSPIRLHVVVLNSLSTGTNLLFRRFDITCITNSNTFDYMTLYVCVCSSVACSFTADTDLSVVTFV